MSVTSFCIFLGESLILLEKQETIYCFSIFNRSGIVLWYILPKKLFSYVGYMQLWESLFLILLLYIVTTRVLFKLLTARFFMNKLSTLRLIVILLVIISNMHRYFAFYFFFFTDCRFIYQVTFYFPFLFFSWWTLDACSCCIVSLRGDVKKYSLFCFIY